MEFDLSSGERRVKNELKSILASVKTELLRRIEDARIRNHVRDLNGVVDLKAVCGALDDQIDKLTDHAAIAAEREAREKAAKEKNEARLAEQKRLADETEKNKKIADEENTARSKSEREKIRSVVATKVVGSTKMQDRIAKKAAKGGKK